MKKAPTIISKQKQLKIEYTYCIIKKFLDTNMINELIEFIEKNKVIRYISRKILNKYCVKICSITNFEHLEVLFENFLSEITSGCRMENLVYYLNTAVKPEIQNNVEVYENFTNFIRFTLQSYSMEDIVVAIDLEGCCCYKNKQLKKYTLLLDMVSLDVMNGYEYNVPLITAAQNGDLYLEAVAELIYRGVNENVTNVDGKFWYEILDKYNVREVHNILDRKIINKRAKG